MWRKLFYLASSRDTNFPEIYWIRLTAVRVNSMLFKLLLFWLCIHFPLYCCAKFMNFVKPTRILPWNNFRCVIIACSVSAHFDHIQAGIWLFSLQFILRLDFFQIIFFSIVLGWFLLTTKNLNFLFINRNKIYWEKNIKPGKSGEKYFPNQSNVVEIFLEGSNCVESGNSTFFMGHLNIFSNNKLK